MGRDPRNREALLRHRFEQIQNFPRPIEEVFDFFTQIRNLEEMTPPFLHFRNLTSGRVEIRTGAEIEHSLRLFGLPLRWLSRIEEFEPNVHFVDRQLRGPYKFWVHRHTFRALPGGCEMRDQVEYELPFGVLGELAGGLVTRRLVRRIFHYRKAVLADRFGTLRVTAEV